jgi:hypothetical protein
MRRTTMPDPWLESAPYEPMVDARCRTHRAECSDLVDLARRMNIPADYAIQHFMDVSFSPSGR